MKLLIKNISKIVISYFSLLAISYVSGLHGNTFYSNGLLSLFIYILISILVICFFNFKLLKEKKRLFIFSILMCVILSFTLVFGYNIYTYKTIKLNKLITYFYTCGLSVIIYSVINMFYLNRIKISTFIKKNFKINFLNKYIYNSKTFIKVFLLIIIAWLPVFLAFYPVIFSYDAPYQNSDFYYWIFDSGNPLIHTLLIGSLLKIGYVIFNNYNVGLLLYSILQSLILAATLSYVICYLNKKSKNIYLKTITLLLFMFLPTHSLFAITTTKDVLFSCFVCILFTKIIDIVLFNEEFFKKDICIKNIIKTIIISVLVLVFRPNGIYGYTLLSIFLLLFIKDNRKKIFIIIVISYVLNSTYNFVMPKIFYQGKTRPGFNSPLYYVPMQQLGRVYKYGNLSKKKKKYLNSLLSKKEKVFDNYCPHIVDPLYRASDGKYQQKNKNKIMKQYLKYLKKYPLIYIDAFLDNSITYWYISDIFLYDDYYRPYLELYTEDRDYTTDNQIKNETKIRFIYDKYKYYFEYGHYQNIPVLSFFMSNGVYNLLLLFSIIFLFCIRKYKKIIPMIFLFGLVGTNFLGPVSLTRYCYYLYISAPVIIYLCFENKYN